MGGPPSADERGNLKAEEESQRSSEKTGEQREREAHLNPRFNTPPPGVLGLFLSLSFASSSSSLARVSGLISSSSGRFC